MMGTHPHHPMAVSIVGRELRQALIAILTLGTTKEGITIFYLGMFILIMIMLLIMNDDQGIEKHLPFVVYLTIPFPCVGKEWQHSRGMKDPLNSMKRNRLRRYGGRNATAVIAT